LAWPGPSAFESRNRHNGLEFYRSGPSSSPFPNTPPNDDDHPRKILSEGQGLACRPGGRRCSPRAVASPIHRAVFARILNGHSCLKTGYALVPRAPAILGGRIVREDAFLEACGVRNASDGCDPVQGRTGVVNKQVCILGELHEIARWRRSPQITIDRAGVSKPYRRPRLGKARTRPWSLNPVHFAGIGEHDTLYGRSAPSTSCRRWRRTGTDQSCDVAMIFTGRVVSPRPAKGPAFR
jgi:hypothetical protein